MQNYEKPILNDSNKIFIFNLKQNKVNDVSKEHVILGKGEINKPQKIAFQSEGFDLEVYAKMNGLKRYLRVLKNID